MNKYIAPIAITYAMLCLCVWREIAEVRAMCELRR